MNWYKTAGNYIAYHGSPKSFQEFSYDFLGSNGTYEGFGFYFTSDKSIADRYAENGELKKAILDIKKPLNATEVTISGQELAKFLRALDPTGEDYLSNWGEVDLDGYERVLNAAVDGELGGAGSDADLISGIVQASGRNAELVNKTLTQTLGYDGIIVEKPSWGKNHVIYVVFDNSQIRYI